jgi:hypothetical protein
MSIAIPLIRWFFVALLVASGAAKLLDLQGFFAVVATFAVLPEASIPAFALGLALLEISLALWLGYANRLSSEGTNSPLFRPALAVLLLHFAYFAWLAVAYMRGLHIPNCGCFGVYWPRPLTLFTLVEDAWLIALASVLVRAHAKKPT